jgi:copper oxidase (laccase) domain-containing protein
VIPAAVTTLGVGLLAAAIGPGIGPCCYEVGEDVAGPMRTAFGLGLVHEGRLDLPGAAERALRGSGVARVDRLDECTACNPDRFFSHRRDGGVTGRQGAIGYVA